MSGLKSIEMQVALPRTQSAGKIQDQLQQRTAVAQGQLAEAGVKKQERVKQTVTSAEQTLYKRLANDEERGTGSGGQQEGKKGHKKISTLPGEDHVEEHPYKGVHFDAKW
ncbi:hypothetical protein [Evansella clarkii]|jgi:hypothetical protein|uniref:hypothetical protein n=1 Tax=Evansella clarkii TaxID=79879 RepID=UPI000996E88A|nr:hypothetical protein [Evansella clarkii]